MALPLSAIIGGRPPPAPLDGTQRWKRTWHYAQPFTYRAMSVNSKCPTQTTQMEGEHSPPASPLQPGATVTVEILKAALDERFGKQLDDLSKVVSKKVREAMKDVRSKVDANQTNIAKNSEEILALKKQSDENQASINSVSSIALPLCHPRMFFRSNS